MSSSKLDKTNDDNEQKIDSDAQNFQLQVSRIGSKYFSRAFNPFEFYNNDEELTQTQKVVKNAVSIITDRCYRGFNSSTTSFRHVLKTFQDSQTSIRRLRLDIEEGQRILFTHNHNLRELFYQQLTHQNILRILTLIETINQIPTRIASFLSRHQYYRAVILLLHGLDLLNTAELRLITALLPVREELLGLKDDLQRVLYVELKNLIFLQDPRLRQSVLDGGNIFNNNNNDNDNNNNNNNNDMNNFNNPFNQQGGLNLKKNGIESFTTENFFTIHQTINLDNNAPGAGNNNNTMNNSANANIPPQSFFTSPSQQRQQQNQLRTKFRFVGSSGYIDHPYGVGYGFNKPNNMLSIDDGDGSNNNNLNGISGLTGAAGAAAAAAAAATSNFQNKQHLLRNNLSRFKKKEKKNKDFSLHLDDDNITGLPLSMDVLKSSLNPSFIDVMTPIKSDIIYSSHPHTFIEERIVTSEATRAFQNYLSTYNYELGVLRDNDLNNTFNKTNNNNNNNNNIFNQNQNNNNNNNTTTEDSALLPILALCEAATNGVSIENTHIYGPQLNQLLSVQDGPSTSFNILSNINKDFFNQYELNNDGKLKNKNNNNNQNNSNNNNNNNLFEDEEEENNNNNENNNNYNILNKKSTKNINKTGKMFHSRYLYRLMALENTPSYIADPSAHPEEYIAVLIESLHLLNYLPAVEQRLVKQSADAVRQLIQRETNALSQQVLTYIVHNFKYHCHIYEQKEKMRKEQERQERLEKQKAAALAASATGKNAALINNNNNNNGTTTNDNNDLQQRTTVNSYFGLRNIGSTGSNNDNNNNGVVEEEFKSLSTLGGMNNILQHDNVLVALLPWDTNLSSIDLTAQKDEISRSNRHNSKSNKKDYLTDESNNLTLTKSTSNLTKNNNNKNAFKGALLPTTNDSTSISTSLDKLLPYASSTTTHGGLIATTNINDYFNNPIIKSMLSILHQDREFQSTLFIDVLTIICKLCTQILVNYKRVLGHLLPLKNFPDLRKEMTIQQYHHHMNNTFFNYEVLITVHESIRRLYSNIQLQLQFVCWKFWDKTREPISFSIDDEIISHILSSQTFNSYKQGLTKNVALQNIQNLTQMTPQLFYSLFKGNATGLKHNLLKLTHHQHIINANNNLQQQQQQQQGNGDDKNENNKDAILRFSFANSRQPSIARQNIHADFNSQDFEQDALRRKQRQREKRNNKNGNNNNSNNNNNDDDDFDFENDLTTNGSGDVNFLQIEDSNLFQSNPYNVALSYLPLLHFADTCNVIVDGTPGTPYLSSPPMYELFPHLIKNNFTCALQYFQYQKNKQQKQQQQQWSSPKNNNNNNQQNKPPVFAFDRSISVTLNQAKALTASTTTLIEPSLDDFLLPICDLRSAVKKRIEIERIKKERSEAAQSMLKKKIRESTAQREGSNNNNQSSHPFANNPLLSHLPTNLMHLIPQEVFTIPKEIHKQTIGQLTNQIKDFVKPTTISGGVNIQTTYAATSPQNDNKNNNVEGGDTLTPLKNNALNNNNNNNNNNTNKDHTSIEQFNNVKEKLNTEHLYVHTGIFKPYPIPTNRSLLQQTALNTSFFHSSYPLTQSILLVIQDILLPYIHNDVVRAVEYIIESPTSFHPLENPLITPFATSAQLSSTYSSLIVDQINNKVNQQKNILEQQKILEEEKNNKNNKNKKNNNDKNNNNNKTHQEFQKLASATDPDSYLTDIFQIHRPKIYQDAALTSTTPFNNLYSFFITVNNGTLASHHLISQFLQASTSNLHHDLFIAQRFLNNNNPPIIHGAYDVFNLIRSLSQDMCLLPHFSSYVMSLMQYSVDKFVESVRLKYNQISCKHPTGSEIYSTSLLTQHLNVRLMSKDLWFMDYRGIPRQDLLNKTNYISQFCYITNNNQQNQNQNQQNNNNITTLSTTPQIQTITQQYSLHTLPILNTMDFHRSTSYSRSYLSPELQESIDLFFSQYNPIFTTLFHQDTSIKPLQLLPQIPIDFSTQSLRGNNTTSALQFLTLQQQQQEIIEKEKQRKLLESQNNIKNNNNNNDKLDLSSGGNQTFNTRGFNNKSAASSPTHNNNNNQNNNNIFGPMNNNNRQYTTITSQIASNIMSHRQNAMKPLSYLALLSSSLDWLSNSFYNMCLPGVAPLSFSQAAQQREQQNFSTQFFANDNNLKQGNVLTTNHGNNNGINSLSSPNSRKQVVMKSSFINTPNGMMISNQNTNIRRGAGGGGPGSVMNPHNKGGNNNSNGLQRSASLLNASSASFQQSSQNLFSSTTFGATNAATSQWGDHLTLIPIYISNGTLNVTKAEGMKIPVYSLPASFHNGVYTPLISDSSNAPNYPFTLSTPSVLSGHDAIPELSMHGDLFTAQQQNNNNKTKHSSLLESFISLPQSYLFSTIAITGNSSNGNTGVQMPGQLALGNNNNNNNNNNNSAGNNNNNNNPTGMKTGLLSTLGGGLASATNNFGANFGSLLDPTLLHRLGTNNGTVQRTSVLTYNKNGQTTQQGLPDDPSSSSSSSSSSTTATIRKRGGSTSTTTTTTTTTSTTNNNNKMSVLENTPGLNQYTQFFDFAVNNTGSGGYDANDNLLITSVTQPLLQYNAKDIKSSSVALSRCLALIKMLPTTSHTRVYAAEETFLRGYIGQELELLGRDAQLIDTKQMWDVEDSLNNQMAIPTDWSLQQLHSFLSLKRYQLTKKLYELSNLCLFNIKLEIFTRLVYHLDNIKRSSYNQTPPRTANIDHRDRRMALLKTQTSMNSANKSNSNQNPLTQLLSIDAQVFILDLNKDLISIDQSLTRFTTTSCREYLYGGMSYLIQRVVIQNLKLIQPKYVSTHGAKVLLRNVHAIQQCLLTFIPQQHSLTIVDSFPDFFHHNMDYNELNFARLRQFIEMMKMTQTYVQTQSALSHFPFTQQELLILMWIIQESTAQRKIHDNVKHSMEQFLQTSAQHTKRESYQMQHSRQEKVNATAMKQHKMQQKNQASITMSVDDYLGPTTVSPTPTPVAVKKKVEKAQIEEINDEANTSTNTTTSTKDGMTTTTTTTTQSDDFSLLTTLHPTWNTTTKRDVNVQRERGADGSTTTRKTTTTVILKSAGEPTVSTTIVQGKPTTSTSSSTTTTSSSSSSSSTAATASSGGGFWDRLRGKK